MTLQLPGFSQAPALLFGRAEIRAGQTGGWHVALEPYGYGWYRLRAP